MQPLMLLVPPEEERMMSLHVAALLFLLQLLFWTTSRPLLTFTSSMRGETSKSSPTNHLHHKVDHCGAKRALNGVDTPKHDISCQKIMFAYVYSI